MNPPHNSGDDFESAMRSILFESIRTHIAGWQAKISDDFSKRGYNNELMKLQGDQVYSQLSFDRPEYVLIRLMGRMSISIGRRLGEIYDKLPRIAAAERFGLSVEDVVQKLANLELDLTLRAETLTDTDRDHLENLLSDRFDVQLSQGVAIEIRYNFNPNDSSRLRKDVQLAGLVQEAELFPVYLVFSSISPRDDAIARLGRAGWQFLIGPQAYQFLIDLLGFDLVALLEGEEFQAELKTEVSDMMCNLFTSYAFVQASQTHMQEK